MNIMNKMKSSDIKWYGEEVPSYNNVSLNGKQRKYYNMFIRKGVDYKVSDFAIFRTKYDDPKSQKICQLQCLFQEGNEFRAMVIIYEGADEFRKYFLSLSVDYDLYNEVVLDSTEEMIINLQNILRKCRVIPGSEDDSVKEVIDSRNLNRSIYFLCRYKYTQNDDLVPLSKIDITNEERTVKKRTPLKTPSRKIMSTSRSTGVKKTYLEPIEDERSHLCQVRRNLNNSFKDIASEDEKNDLNYSVIEHDHKNLKIKLRVSNGKVLSKIPSKQPIVLLNKIEVTPSKVNDIYELNSPNFRKLLKNSEIMNVEYNDNMKTSTPDKIQAEFVQNMEEINKYPIRSPRKLRRMTRPLYKDNYSDTDSDDFTRKRKVAVSKKDNNATPNTPVRRSTRVKKNGLNHDFEYSLNLSGGSRKRKQVNSPIVILSDSDSDISSIKPTRKNRLKADEDFEVNTPSKKSVQRVRTPSVRTPCRQPKTPKTIKGTPLRMLRNGTLTPTVDHRIKVVENCATPLTLARNTLHVSYVPKILPCREKEYKDVYNFIQGKLVEKCGGCMYISGVPGTGKTATVTAAIDNITKTWNEKGFGDFNFVSINGMKLTEPRQCYVEILKQLDGRRVPWEQALTILEKQFTTKSAKKVVPTVLLIDELDILCTKRQDVVYNLLDWPTKTNAQLIVVTIANTMDLPERLLMSRVTSRLGLTRLTFQAYTHKQLQEIVINRLSGNKSFKADAIQFVARKVASVSGDARRALDICRRSAEIAELEGPNTQVSMQHVNAALEAMITQPKVKAILRCSKLEKLLLKAVIAEVERTGLEETILEEVYLTLNSLATLEGFKMVSHTLVIAAVYRLTSCRLLLSDQNCNGADQRILLNVSSDDVYFALKKD